MISTHLNQGTRTPSTTPRAFTLIELIVVLAVIILLVALLIPALSSAKTKSSRIKCVNNLKNIGLGFRIFTGGNKPLIPSFDPSTKSTLPSITIVELFQSLSNALSTPMIIRCPEDKQRPSASSFVNLSAKNISYFASLTARSDRPQAFLAGDRNIATNGVLVSGALVLTTNTPVRWTKEMHNEQGNILMGDGSVQQMSSSRLQSSLREYVENTETLIFP